MIIRPGTGRTAVSALLALATHMAPALLVAQTAATRPLSWLDIQNMRQIGTPVASPDGRAVLHTLSVPDWKETRRQSDDMDAWWRQSPAAHIKNARTQR